MPNTNTNINITKTVNNANETKEYALVITSTTIGDGDMELGEKLMSNYLIALSETKDAKQLPTNIFLINSGAKLAAKSSNLLEILEAIQDRGVKFLVCGTCLDYYNIKNELAVGEVSNIYAFRDLVASMDKVVTLS